MNNLRMFIPLTKVDAEKRLVYGLATGETVDRSGEICDYATTKPYYEKWSGNIAKATDGKSLGNLRAMHGKVAAGKVTAIAFNDEAKQIEICAKVVDDAEWVKVEEGVYTGFSQGGGYVKRWKDDAGLQRYTADPSEVSLVDLPCLETATFQMIKVAGAVETRHFAESVQVKAEPTNAEVAEKAGELAKVAGRETEWAAFLDEARTALKKAALPPPPEVKVEDDGVRKEAAPVTPPAPGEGVEQVWLSKDCSTHAKKADALSKNAEIDAKAVIAPSTKAVTDELEALADKLGIAKADASAKSRDDGNAKDRNDGVMKRKKRIGSDGQPMKSTTAEDLAKDLYSASRFAQLLAELEGFAASAEYQAFFDKDDDSEFASMLKAWVGQGRSLLIAMVQDEADDVLGSPVPIMEAAANMMRPGVVARLVKAFDAIEPLKEVGKMLAKAGARNSKADQEKVQAMHDHTCDLGATCDADNCDGTEKSTGTSDLAKAMDAMTASRDAEKARGDALQKTIDDQIVPMLKAIGAKVEKIEKQPMPLPFANQFLRVADKGGEGVSSDDVKTEIERMQKEDPDGLRLILHKIAQSQPRQMHAG